MVADFPNFCAGVHSMMFKSKSLVAAHSVSVKTSSRKIRPVRTEEDEPRDTAGLHQLHQPYQVLRRATPKSRPFLRRTGPREHILSSDTNDPESFHCAIGGILSLAQFFGILPVIGVRESSPLKLRFAKYAIRTVCAAINLGLIFLMTVLAVIHMMRTLNASAFEVKGGIAAATAGAVFYGNTLIASCLFFRLSPRWPALAQEWRAMEIFIDCNKSERPLLRWKFFIIASTVLLLALLEHLLSVLNVTVDRDWLISSSSPAYDFLYTYSMRSHAFVFESLNYNVPLGIYIFVVSKTATFSWNFMDLFVMLMSTSLAERYKTLNRLVISASLRKAARTTIDWGEYREDYAILSGMVKRVDREISPIILLSFANNLYFICLQLLNGLSSGPSDSTLLSTAYFFGSFAFLICRTIAVTLFAARVNDQSKIALPAIYSCPPGSFTTETQRLQYQLTTDEIAFTGLRFFSITRNFMLAVAGAIVTYEVVLLQFNVAINN